MVAYVIAEIEVNNPEEYDSYRAGVPETGSRRGY